MQRKEQLVILFILIFIIGSISVLIYKAKQGEYANFIEYTSPSGETFAIENRSIGETHQYYVHAFVENHEYVLPFRYPPAAVDDISVQEDVMHAVYRPQGVKQLYITQDVDLPAKTDQKSFMGLVEFGKVLGTNEFGVYKIQSRSAFTSFEEEGIPIIRCEDVSATEAVIYMRLGDENKVYVENECVIVQGVDGEGLLRTSDRFGYHLLGVI